LDEKKSKHASLVQQIGFDQAFMHRMVRLAKRHGKALTPTVN
jgi:hypothetical protein